MPYVVDHVYPPTAAGFGSCSVLQNRVELQRPRALDHDDFPLDSRVLVPLPPGLEPGAVGKAVVDALRIVAAQTGFEGTAQRLAAVDERDLVVVGVAVKPWDTLDALDGLEGARQQVDDVDALGHQE